MPFFFTIIFGGLFHLSDRRTVRRAGHLQTHGGKSSKKELDFLRLIVPFFLFTMYIY